MNKYLLSIACICATPFALADDHSADGTSSGSDNTASDCDPYGFIITVQPDALELSNQGPYGLQLRGTPDEVHIVDEHDYLEPRLIDKEERVSHGKGDRVAVIGDLTHLMTTSVTYGYNVSEDNFTIDLDLQDALDIYSGIIDAHPDQPYDNITITNNCIAIGLLDIAQQLLSDDGTHEEDDSDDGEFSSLIKTYNKTHKKQASITSLPKSIQSKLSKTKA
ncbi:MAG: hypothetical protein ACON5A_03000 [Candidatus Comchoanobacterales bacterium]